MKIPTFLEIAEVVEYGNPTALDTFIYYNEPEEECEQFRSQLIELIEYVEREARK